MPMKEASFTAVSAHRRREIAALSCVCDQTVRRYFAGLPIRSTSRARIEMALPVLATERTVERVLRDGGARV